jgi:hypothetical protein
VDNSATRRGYSKTLFSRYAPGTGRSSRQQVAGALSSDPALLREAEVRTYEQQTCALRALTHCDGRWMRTREESGERCPCDIISWARERGVEPLVAIEERRRQGLLIDAAHP